MIDLNNKEELGLRLEELEKLQLPCMTIESFAEYNTAFKKDLEEATEEEVSKITEYLANFLDDEDKGICKCIICGCIPVLNWGLQHGVAIDSNTGLEWKMYHYLTLGGVQKRYEVILQYHPSCYTVRD